MRRILEFPRDPQEGADPNERRNAASPHKPTDPVKGPDHVDTRDTAAVGIGNHVVFAD